jgi:MraZ protein
MMQKEVKDFLRFFYSSAVECPLDRQGRILLPNHLRHYAKLNRDVVLIGMMSKIEVWGERQWKEKEGQVGQSAERISSALTGLGL